MNRKHESLTAYLSLLPAFAFLILIIGYPLLNTFFHSFTHWDGIDTRYAGLEHYMRMMRSGDLLLLLRNNFIFILSVPLILLVSLLVSAILFDELPGWKFFRSVYYVPCILSAVVIGYLMKAIFSSRGLVNSVLIDMGLESWAIQWLNNVPAEFAILILSYYLQTLGGGVLIFLAGMSGIPGEIFEGAILDGASWRQRLLRITIPMLYPVLTFFTVTNIVYLFTGMFSLIFSVTGGGPGYETSTFDFMIYLQMFQSGNLGYACALSIFLFVLVFAVTRAQLQLSRRLSE